MAKVKKIRKWDEVTGNAVEEQIPESIDPLEDVGAGPSISRNHMRGIEDMVEQNDNSCFLQALFAESCKIKM